MHTVADEYEGKHRIEQPITPEGFAARQQIASALRGVPNESPRHAERKDAAS